MLRPLGETGEHFVTVCMTKVCLAVPFFVKEEEKVAILKLCIVHCFTDLWREAATMLNQEPVVPERIDKLGH